MSKEQFIITTGGTPDAYPGNCRKTGAVIRLGPGFVEGQSTLDGNQTAECKIIGNRLGGQPVIILDRACQNDRCPYNFGYTG